MLLPSDFKYGNLFLSGGGLVEKGFKKIDQYSFEFESVQKCGLNIPKWYATLNNDVKTRISKVVIYEMKRPKKKWSRWVKEPIFDGECSSPADLIKIFIQVGLIPRDTEVLNHFGGIVVNITYPTDDDISRTERT